MSRKKKLRYAIALYCNNKRIKFIKKTTNRELIHNLWFDMTTEKIPPYTKKYDANKRGQKLKYELLLLYPQTRFTTAKTYKRTNDGKLVEAVIKDDYFRIKKIVPYWVEETIYDHKNKKQIRFHELMNIIYDIKDIAQIFSLNNKIFVQIENNIRFFGCKNINDAQRLFETIRNEAITNKKGGYIFVKDINSHQRSILYKLLEEHGYKKSMLIKHYSY